MIDSFKELLNNWLDERLNELLIEMNELLIE